MDVAPAAPGYDPTGENEQAYWRAQQKATKAQRPGPIGAASLVEKSPCCGTKKKWASVRGICIHHSPTLLGGKIAPGQNR